MTYTKTLLAASAITTGFWLTACTSSGVPLNKTYPSSSPSTSSTPVSSTSSSGDYVYKGINFGGHRNADFKQGVRDGCRTEGGNYTKTHSKFKNNESYRIGWEDGRLKCKG